MGWAMARENGSADPGGPVANESHSNQGLWLLQAILSSRLALALARQGQEEGAEGRRGWWQRRSEARTTFRFQQRMAYL